MSDERFKRCPACDQWFTLKDILDNPELEPVGLSFEEGFPQANLFYFQHANGLCNSSFVIPVAQLIQLIDEPIPENILGGTDKCSAHCTQLDDWAACGQDCYYAPFRRFLINLIKRKGLSVPIDLHY